MTAPSRQAIAWVISPINALQCVIAYRYMQSYFKQNISLKILQYYPTLDDDLSREMFNTVSLLIHSIDPTIECITTSNSVVDDHKALKETIGKKDIDYIFLAHDVVGNLFESLRALYPKAENVCYGDALGQFFQKEVHLGLLQAKQPWKQALKTLLRRNELPKSGKMDYAVLTIPVSQARLPKHTKLLIPPHDLARSVFEECTLNNVHLTQYCERLVKDIEARSVANVFLFPIENMAEGNFLSFEQETELYAEAILKHCPQGSIVFIKQHPGEQLDHFFALEKRLETTHILQKIDPKFKRYPIELFSPLLKKCCVVSMFYPVLSLKYLYDMDVIQPLTENIIERYFVPLYWKSYKNAVNLNTIPLSRLKNWDRKSLLYNGR